MQKYFAKDIQFVGLVTNHETKHGGERCLKKKRSTIEKQSVIRAIDKSTDCLPKANVI